MIFKRLYIPIFIIALVVSSINLFATHNRAGEITYVQISELTYEITVTTYTYTLSNVDRKELEVEWGDGTFTTVPRRELLQLPDDYQRNRYVARHTFPGSGVYVILVQDPNRNYGVENIPNSVNTVFSVKSTIFVNPDLGLNNAPVLLNPPINQAAQYKTFIHNPGAFDYEGDSLVYSLINCTGEDGEAITGYSLPPATTSIGINAITGDLVWETPSDAGGFNLAIQIEEWRTGVKIGAITRDMQIDVYETENIPPKIDSIGGICVLVGDTANVLIRSSDLDLNSIELSATGGPFLFETNPATFEEVSSIPGETVSEFTWITHCNHIRKESYTVLINAQDEHPEVNLADVERLLVKVIGPAPSGLVPDPGNAFIRLNWDAPNNCVPEKYLIYRKIGSLNYVHDSCTTGLPDNSEYEFVGEATDTVYVDNNNGEGLVQGFDYCYRIVAEYADGAQSFPSEEQCASLAPGFPNITNVSVENTDLTNGEIMVRWLKPTRLDTIPEAVGPFKYIIYRSDDEYGMRLKRIDSIAGLDDTTYYDLGLNTTETHYSYRIALYNVTPGNRFRIGNPQLASSIFLDLVPSDNQVEINILKNTPWLDNEYVIYRLNNSTSEYDSIAYTTNRTYTDTKLKNGNNYCYQVKSIGTYMVDTVESPTINWSHENCQIPEDFQRPCPPTLNVVSDCDNSKNILTWNNPNLTCADDVVAYKVYFVQNTEMSLDYILRIEGAEITSFEHDIEDEGLESMGGCYAVAAIDSFNNESDASYVQCVDDCSYFELPNVFSPNNDGVNDIYTAINPLNYVKRLELNIYNRWGELVYHTADAKFQWDGRAQSTKNIVAPGVYYYICDVWEPRISGLELRNIVGFIHVYTGTSSGEFNNE